MAQGGRPSSPPLDLFVGFDATNAARDGQQMLNNAQFPTLGGDIQDDTGMMMYYDDPSAFFNGFGDMPGGMQSADGVGGALSGQVVMDAMFPDDMTGGPTATTTTDNVAQAGNLRHGNVPLGDGLGGDAGAGIGAGASDSGTITNAAQSSGNSNNSNRNDSSNDNDSGGTQREQPMTSTVDGLGNISEGPGAGPQPTTDLGQGAAGAGGLAGSGAGGAAGVGGTGGVSLLTEFTRRKNWPAKVVEELVDTMQILEPNGRIRFVSPSITSLLGYTVEEAVGQSLTDLVHADDRYVFVSELNACIANASMMRMFYRVRRRDGTYAVVESVGHAHIAASRFAPNPTNKSPFCQAVFLMSRPYPTKNSALLDSFLEHKMENERLRRRIDDLRREAASEDQASTEGGGGGLSALGGGARNTASGFMPPPLPPGFGGSTSASGTPGQGTVGSIQHNAMLTRENLEGIPRRPDSLRDKMARYEGMTAASAVDAARRAGGATPGGGSGPGGSAPASIMTGGHNKSGNRRTTGPMGTATHADTIEMLTGLRYQEGERSRGLSTGNRSPRLVKGDAGIAFSLDREQRAGEKKKKMRLVEEYVCTDCGTLESPEWRKGPSGPKTLCNACGLRWAKKEKKEKKEKKKVGEEAGSPRRNWDEQ